MNFVIDVTNDGPVTIPLARLTLRYWYTVDGAKVQELDCDVAALGCTNVVTSPGFPPAATPQFFAVMPARSDANEYAEIAFTAGAFALDQLLNTGPIQLRLRNRDGSGINQADDYSFDCSALGSSVKSTKIAAYVDGVLVWGTEPT